MRERVVVARGSPCRSSASACNNFGWRLDVGRHTGRSSTRRSRPGSRSFDTAESYGDGESEEFLGRALAGRRDRVVIATKFGWGRGLDDNAIARGHPEYVRGAIEGSLRRLGTDYVDLYQYHRPDGVTPIEETLGAMSELVDEGKVRFIGSSNFSAAQVEEADRVGAERGFARFVTAQNEYSWLERGAEEELIPACERLGVALLPVLPARDAGCSRGSTAAARRSRRARGCRGGLDVSDEQWARIEALEAVRRPSGACRLLDVAIGGLAAQPTVCSVIAGAMTPEQVRANAAAARVGAVGGRARTSCARSDVRRASGRRWRPAGSGDASSCGRVIAAGERVARLAARSAAGPERSSSSRPGPGRHGFLAAALLGRRGG